MAIASKHTPATKDEDCSKLLEDEKTTREIALARCECLMDRYHRWKRQNHWKSDLAQRVVLIFTAAIPVVLLLPLEHVNIIGAAVSALVAIATGLQAISGWRENYIRYGYVRHALQSEKYRYLTHATEEYSGSDTELAARNFARRIEQLVMAEVTDWRVEVQRVEHEKRNGTLVDYNKELPSFRN